MVNDQGFRRVLWAALWHHIRVLGITEVAASKVILTLIVLKKKVEFSRRTGRQIGVFHVQLKYNVLFKLRHFESRRHEVNAF